MIRESAQQRMPLMCHSLKKTEPAVFCSANLKRPQSSGFHVQQVQEGSDFNCSLLRMLGPLCHAGCQDKLILSMHIEVGTPGCKDMCLNPPDNVEFPAKAGIGSISSPPRVLGPKAFGQLGGIRS